MHVCVCVCLRVFNGLCTLQHGKILSRLPLPICISNAKANTLAHRRRQCKTAKTPGELRLLELNRLVPAEHLNLFTCFECHLSTR